MSAIDYGSYEWPPGGSGSGSDVTIYANFAAFPVSAPVGTLAIDASTGILYEFFAGSWQILAQLGGGGGGGTPEQGIPTGSVDGVNVTFTVPTAPTAQAAFVLYQDGLEQRYGVDYTMVGTTITMTTPPAIGQTLDYTDIISSGMGAGVTTLNTLSGDVIFAAGTNITLTPVGNTITIDASGGSSLVVNGTRGAPQLITDVGGIPFSGSQTETKSYIAGNGGPIVVTANPQIPISLVDGAELTLQSRDATNTVEIQDGNGLVMNGPWIGGLDSSITFTCDLVNWVEKCRQ